MGAAASMAQLNVRMDPELKAAGDQVLELMGYTPVQVVRALWEKIARGPEAFQEVVDLLAAHPAASGAPEIAEEYVPEPASQSAWVVARQQQLAHELGLDLSTFVPMTDEEYEDYRYQEWIEQERERLVNE